MGPMSCNEDPGELSKRALCAILAREKYAGQLACHVNLPSVVGEPASVSRLFFWHGLAGVTCELRTGITEGSVDSRGESLHTSRSCKGHECDNECVLDKVLALFAGQDALNLD